MTQVGTALDVLVIGGGIIGMSIAEALAIEGLSVRLIESDAVGSGASGAAAGMLAPISEAPGAGPLLDFGLEGLRLLAPLCDRLRSETGIDPEFEASGLLRLAFDSEAAAELKARAKWGAEASASAWMGLGSMRRGKPPLEWVETRDLILEEPAISDSVQ